MELSFDGHSDWVNDIALRNNILISASIDRTIKIWNSDSAGFKFIFHVFQFLLTDILLSKQMHSDYVTSLSSSPNTRIFASGGLKAEIFLWDFEV